jgi:hypothetical protein
MTGWPGLLHGLVRAALALLFVGTGALKLTDPAGFATDVANYQMLPAGAAGLLALSLPPLEVVAGAGLCWRRYARGAALLCSSMLVGFAVAMAQSKLRGIDLACGCFGALADAQVSWLKVTGNLALAILAGWVAWHELPKKPAPERSA